MKQIHFAFDQEEHKMDSLIFTENLTQNTLYEYVEETLGKPVILSYDQSTIIERNDILLTTLFNIQLDVHVYCRRKQDLEVTIYLDHFEYSVMKTDDSVTIDEVRILLSQLLGTQQKLQKIRLAECSLYDQQGSQISNHVDIKQPFSSYVQGLQAVVLYLVRQPIDPLEHLVVLKNISLWIDPDGQYVTFKFHFPEVMCGYLYKNKGKQPHTVALTGCNWITVNKVQYSIIDDYGFAVTWDDGTISQIHYH